MNAAQQPRQIVGVMLARNEDKHIAWALANIVDFCDRIIVLDNYSTDRTFDVVAAMREKHPKIEARRWWNAKTSQKALREFYQTPSWVFRVDGDEIHEPAALGDVRRRIMQGEFDSVYQPPLACHVLNCTAVSMRDKTATGYAFPTRLGLHNFAAVRGWENENRERLHGHPVFIDDRFSTRVSHDKPAWHDAPLRCLHLCFMPRTSGATRHPFALIGWKRRRKERIKPNPSGNPHHARPGPGNTVEYKMQKYATGELMRHNIDGFIRRGSGWRDGGEGEPWGDGGLTRQAG